VTNTRTPDEVSGGPAGSAAGRPLPRDLAAAKERGEGWAMVTAYDFLTAKVLEEAGITVLLVGDSAAGAVYGHPSSDDLTVDELVPLARAVVRGSQQAMVVADLPHGSYESSPGQALATAGRFLAEAGVHAVKIEGGLPMTPQISALTSAGVAVMGHLDYAAEGGDHAGIRRSASALQAAGAYAIVLRGIPARLSARITGSLRIPTVGIGSGPHCDAQVLRWQDMAGLTPHTPASGRRYADVRSVIREAARDFAEEVRRGTHAQG